VKVNETAGADNMAYMQTKQRRDHYWGEDAAKDGYHRKVEMPKQTSAPALSASMDGSLFALDTTDTVTELFYMNSTKTYQLSPTFKSGVTGAKLSSSYQDVVAVPANVYGEITMWYLTQMQTGSFISDASKVYVFSTLIKIQGNTNDRPRFVEFGNGSDSVNFNIRAKVGGNNSGSAEIWNYKITYRDI